MCPGPVNTVPEPVPDAAVQHLVPMRDRVSLATDVYLPAGASGPVPAVLVRLPYDKNSRYVYMDRCAERLTARGYALVVQDVRGKYRSDGAPIGPLSEVNDGYDTIDWISKQGWSNGRVGMFGDSYYGFTQWAALSSQHPALKAIVPRVTSTDITQFKGRRHGTVSDVPWLQFVKYIAQCWTGSFVYDEEPDWEIAPLTEVFENYFAQRGERSYWYDLLVPRALPVPVYSSGHPHLARPVPTLHCVGWYDNVATLSMRDYLKLCSDPSAAPLQYLYANSIDHENYHLDHVPVTPQDDHYESDAALERVLDTYIDPAIDFFDVFLAEVGAAAPPRVRWHLGHVDFREADSWPPAGATLQILYLGGLSQAAEGGGLLQDGPPMSEETTTWDYSPASLVPSSAVNSFAFLFENPDESTTATRSDVLTFACEPVMASVDLVGPVDLYLRVDSSAPTTDVYAKLCDRAPDGTLRQIVRGQGIVDPPDSATVVRIELGHTGYRLRAGHRLELLIASSDYPEYPPNSGTRENRWLAASRSASRQTLYSDAKQPSHLVVSVLPADG